MQGAMCGHNSQAPERTSPEMHALLEELAGQISRQGEANYRTSAGLDRLGSNDLPQPKELVSGRVSEIPTPTTAMARLRELVAQVRMNATMAHENADRLDNTV